MKKIAYWVVLLVLLVACAEKPKQLVVKLTNPSDFDRTNEIVEIKKEKIVEELELSEKQSFVVLDDAQTQIPYQLLSDGETVVFLANVVAEGVSSYTVQKGTPKEFSTMVYGKFVPERKDDFAWENNKVAFRMYGPALEATGEVSNGIDFWAKRTEKLVVDKWYADEFAGVKTYHTDGGEGLDFYKVGRSLGVGAAAPFYDGEMVLGNNFTQYKILEKGPLRFTFELKYAPFAVGEEMLTETRAISLDACSHLNKITEHFEGTAKDFPLALGLVQREEKEKKIFVDKEGVLAYEEPKNPENGIIFTGVVSPKPFSQAQMAEGHLLGIVECASGEFTYYAGAAWNKSDVTSFEDWQAYLLQEKHKIDNPLRVEVE